MPLSGWEETLAVRAIQAPAGAVRSRGGGWGGGGGVSAQRGSRPPGTRAARVLRRRIFAKACAHSVRRAALRLSSGSCSGQSSSAGAAPRDSLSS